MDAARRLLGILLIVSLPPAVIHWLIVHPWVRFWRRAGPWATYGALVLLVVVWGRASLTWRDRVLGRDLQTRWWLVIGVYVIVLASLLLLIPVIVFADRELAAGLGPAYLAYRRRVPALFPRRRA